MVQGYKPEETLLIACEVTGKVRDAFIAKGINAVSNDILPTLSPGPHITAPLESIIEANWIGIIAFPPCTYLTNANNRYKYRNPELIAAAQDFFMSIVRHRTKYLAIENPPGSMNTYYRKPNQIIHPYNFGHNESKPTCLWLRNLPRLNATEITDEINYIIRDMPQTKARAFKRSITYTGIAKAMANQWHNYFQPGN